MVGEAQRTRAPIQRLADVVAAWFVPAVVLTAIVSFVAWSVWGPEPRLPHALLSAVAVLIIACPCALGLATPMAIMVGTGRGAASGVLIRNAEALERLEQVDTADRRQDRHADRGTAPARGGHRGRRPFDESTVLRLAAALEQASEHPLAAAVVAGARERGLSIPEASAFESLTGRGVVGTVEGRAVVVGKPGTARRAGRRNRQPGRVRRCGTRPGADGDVRRDRRRGGRRDRRRRSRQGRRPAKPSTSCVVPGCGS